MNVQSFLKHLKRKLRWKRSWIALGMLIALCTAGYMIHAAGLWPEAGGGAVARMTLAPANQEEEDAKLKEAIAKLKGITDSRETYLLKSYVCGEELQKLGLHTSDQLVTELMKNPNWTLSLNAKGEVTFTEQIDDLSPECKQKAVFSVDESGNLSLFQGTPSKENVIRTFFQLNIRQLESSLPQETVKQLHDGIRITDMEEYNSVLSTFSDYAVEESERAMFNQ